MNDRGIQLDILSRFHMSPYHKWVLKNGYDFIDLLKNNPKFIYLFRLDKSTEEEYSSSSLIDTGHIEYENKLCGTIIK